MRLSQMTALTPYLIDLLDLALKTVLKGSGDLL